ncbi:MAG: aldehyde dehydrogenase [Proteobacteria bacterium]|nr:aldehyde dehydrogenase [Pseudomonadota bacterium]
MKRLELIPDVVRHSIGGELVRSQNGETFDNVNPATGEVICKVSKGSDEEINSAVESATQAWKVGPWSQYNQSQRSSLLRRVGDLILQRKEELAELESLDTGKPISETLNGDIPRAAFNFHFYSELCAHQVSPSFRSDDGSIHTTLREPLGVVGLITPWNLPLYLATWKLAPALAQGNAIVLKPAELTPLTAFAMHHIFQEAGLPPGVVNIVQGFGGASAGEALVKHPGVKAISFTGETVTGSSIMAAGAPTLKKMSFELGGKGASVIFADADLQLAAKTATRAAFRNAGQVCLAGSRLLVEESVFEQVISIVKSEMAQIKMGDPLDPSVTLGSLVNLEHRNKVASYVEYARKTKGHEVIVGGRIPDRFPESSAYFEPTLIKVDSQASRLIQEEVFGPVLTVQTFNSLDQAIELVNGTKYGLSASVWTKDINKAQFVSGKLRMGLVWINSWFIRNLHTAFGGMKHSGVGREGGQYSLDFFSEMKTISQANPMFDAPTKTWI